MIMKRRTLICREGWFYLLVLAFVVAGALKREINLLLVIAGLMVGPLLFNWREVIASLRGLTVRRKLPDGICAGDLLVVDLTLTNTSRRYGSRAVVVEDQIRRENGSSTPERGRGEALFASVPPGGVRHLSYYGRMPRRGRYRFGPLKISTRFPLGLVRRIATVDDRRTMVVCPRLGRLTSAWTSLHQQTPRGTRKVFRGQRMLGADFFSLRDWQSGDSRRSIHWRTSARRGGLVVRQSQQQRQQDVLLVVDLWQPSRPTAAHLQVVERAVSFAATVVADLCRHGESRLDVALGGTELRWSRGTASMARRAELIEQLAVAEACPADQMSELLRLAQGAVRAGTVALVVSTRRVDMADRARFAGLTDRPGSGPSPAGFVAIDASSDTLNRYFALD